MSTVNFVNFGIVDLIDYNLTTDSQIYLSTIDSAILSSLPIVIVMHAKHS